jgi:hypothetical protein
MVAFLTGLTLGYCADRIVAHHQRQPQPKRGTWPGAPPNPGNYRRHW